MKGVKLPSQNRVYTYVGCSVFISAADRFIVWCIVCLVVGAFRLHLPPPPLRVPFFVHTFCSPSYHAFVVFPLWQVWGGSASIQHRAGRRLAGLSRRFRSTRRTARGERFVDRGGIWVGEQDGPSRQPLEHVCRLHVFLCGGTWRGGQRRSVEGGCCSCCCGKAAAAAGYCIGIGGSAGGSSAGCDGGDGWNWRGDGGDRRDAGHGGAVGS